MSPFMRAPRLLAWALAFVLSGTAGACKHGGPGTEAAADAGSTIPSVRAESEGLLLTWIDDKGDFHVETRVADVPMMGRDAVRLVDPSRGGPADEAELWIVDLRQARADGTFPVHSMTRADFDAIALARREQKGPTLANVEPPAPSSGPSPSSSSSPRAGPAAKGSTRGVVVIYGAEWCGACHDAARYLRRKHVEYIEKDVEKDPAAAREMEEKLAKNGLRGGSIPVIDVRGKVMVGFNSDAIDGALGDAL